MAVRGRHVQLERPGPRRTVTKTDLPQGGPDDELATPARAWLRRSWRRSAGPGAGRFIERWGQVGLPHGPGILPQRGRRDARGRLRLQALTRGAAYREIENTLSTKADLVAALQAAFAYCDVAYDALTDSSGTAMTATGKTRFEMLNWNLWHTWEHYGNVVVYLRIKGLVPPSSQKMPGM